MTLVSFILTILQCGTAHQTSASQDATAQARVEAVVASTTAEWEAAFVERGSTYAPPRVIFLRPPPGHPARGAGYSRNIGLVVDLGDAEAVIEAFPDDGASLVALMIAHEIGHHVQAALGDDPEVTGSARERQADCLAGWWITRANDRSMAAGVSPTWPIIDLKTRLPKVLGLLDKLQSGRADGGAANLDTHGAVTDRVAAFEHGMSATAPWTCLWGENP